ncbi:hypothetical protein N9X61_01065 [Sulfurimonas sp.]|nr:hypothetical protein [Sulfurimonas sp.]
MSTEQQGSFSSVISINPYDNEYISGISSFLTKATNPEYSKEQFVSSYLNTQAYISNQILISKNIPQEDVLDAISIKIYDELGLDQAIEYQVQYIETFNNLDGDNRQFQVFIVDPLEIQNTFEQTIETIKYIDTITPFPLLIKSLYSKEIIQDNGIHCFIYFEQNDASITIYNETDFIYTKSLKYSLIHMHERFCELYGEKIQYEDFIKFLSTQNLKYTQSEFKEYILKLYNEIFSNINEILTYAKKAFEIEKIEHVYIGSEIEIASKLYEIAEVELSIPSNDFAFDYGFESNGIYINQIHSLIHLTSTLSDEEKYLCNFSEFHRPPKFTQRESGKLLMLVAASFFIAFAYPITYWVLIYMQELQYELLQTSYNETHTQKTTREANIKSKEAEKAKVVALLTKEKENYTSKKNTLIKIHDVKVNYPMKAKLITTLIADLNRYAVKIEKIQYNQNNEKKNFILNLVSSKDKKITQLLEYLTKKYNKKFNFSLDDILLDEDKKLYFSELKVNIL